MHLAIEAFSYKWDKLDNFKWLCFVLYYICLAA